MKIDVSRFLDTFFQESAEHINTIETGLLRLASTPDDAELLNSIFRAAHSIKGAAGAFGLTDVVRLTHALENLLDLMRNGSVTPEKTAISQMLQAADLLKVLTAGPGAETPAGLDGVILALETLAGSFTASPAQQSNTVDVFTDTAEKDYKLTFSPNADVFASGCNPLLLLRNVGMDAKVVSTKIDTSTLPALADLDCATCYLKWELILSATCNPSEVLAVFEFVEDQAKVELTPLALNPAAVEVPGRSQQVESAQGQPGTSQAAAPVAQPAARESSIRVSTEKIDKVIDLVGEMVIAQAMTSDLVDRFSPELHDRLKECVATLERCIRELHERTLSVRMLPVGTIFARFHRLVHDLAHKTGKKIDLITSGEETEVDRSVIELLGDPLTHLIRNSADHGIELPSERLAAGKPETGKIRLTASHIAGSVLVEIQDDGAGLNLRRIREKAISAGIIPPTADLSEDEVHALIFAPGFSTRDEVSDISGRGVGMDVVKRNITSLNGNIQLASETGRGTSVRIALPLTLAIMDGLIVRVSDHRFVIPLISIIETIPFEEKHVLKVAGRGEAVKLRNEAIPILRLQQAFHLESRTSEQAEERPPLAIVVERGTLRAALIVDELLGQQQLVVKSLEKNFRRIEGALGATILGDGTAGLILDIGALIDSLSKADRSNKDVKPLSLVA